ncbi:MAG: right-handed parallel beta-helix repeat-containing protein [Armatimonadetes bacterium]|nr:right-handed parallel beta-helix repeat-containing protein [Armatimonadota bacterium]
MPRCALPGLLIGLLLAAAPLPAKTLHVAQQLPAAADTNPGTEAQPLKTISAAMRQVQPSDTVLVKDGVYRESVVYPGEDWNDPARRITLAAVPGSHPVVKGSEVLQKGWERLAGERPIYSQARTVYTQLLFVDDQPLQQIGLQGSPKRAAGTNGFQWQKQWDGKGLADMRAGSFLYDDAAKRLYVWLADGGDPARHTFEAAVRAQGIELRGTWTVRGFDIRYCTDDFWPREQAVAVSGNRCVIEDCQVTHNDCLGLILSGEDNVLRGCEIAWNGLMGYTSNCSYRTLVEGNELHHNAWRGDVKCGTAGNKLVAWRDSTFRRNYWHDERNCALWFDISDGNIQIVENRFDRCSVGVYFEISRWAVIANNVFRDCARAIWSYGADVLIAHNVIDGCGEGVTISGYPRHCDEWQGIPEPSHPALMAVRNNLVVDNLLVDCAGSFIGITPDDGYGAGNFSDHNVFAWTLPVSHTTGVHINFMSGWDTLYGRLPEWRRERHCDEHSIVADRVLDYEIDHGNPYIAIARGDIVPDVQFVDRAKGDYRLKPTSPIRGRGVKLPMVLHSICALSPGRTPTTREWAKTLLTDAPDAQRARKVSDVGPGHYRLQPWPGFHRLVDLDGLPADTPGLNAEWSETGRYPTFDPTGPPEDSDPWAWAVYPVNRLRDPSFGQPIAAAAGVAGQPWVSPGGGHSFNGVACLNLLPGNQQRVTVVQKVGQVAPETEYLVWGDQVVSAVDERFAGVGELYLAAGDGLAPVGRAVRSEAPAGPPRHWRTVFAQYRSGQAGADPQVGQDLYVVLGGSVCRAGGVCAVGQPGAAERRPAYCIAVSCFR